MADKTCFVIMPITTPEPYLDRYRDDTEHFKHVLQCLFIPSVEKADYKPIPPIAKGSDLIHAEIINNLEQSDLVLCDMSCLNPNVFFEFGIRTSLNRPVCVVKDEHTKRVPFDTGILNHLEYRSTMEPWELSQEIEKLAEHVRMSHERSKGENSLWKYFGLRTEARAYEGETGTETKLDYLTMQMESLQKQMGALGRTKVLSNEVASYDNSINEIALRIRRFFPRNVRLITTNFNHTENTIIFYYRGNLSEEDMIDITNFVLQRYGMKAEFSRVADRDKTSDL